MANNEINQVVVNGNTYKLVGQDINLAPIETDASSASKSYAIGNHLVVDNDYCEVIAAISAGDALVKGSNIQTAKVGDEINQLNTSLSDKGTARQFVVDISTSSGVEIGRWIKNNISTDILQKGLTFNFIPTLSPGWWSGQMFSDGGETWWGYYMNRDTNILYKYVYAGGADSVTPFKGGHGTKSITANGTYDVTDYASANVNVKTTPTYNSYTPTGEQSYIHMDPNGNTQSGSAYISITGCSATVSNGKLYVNVSERVKVGGPPVPYGQNKFSNDTRTIQVVLNLT